MSMTKLALYKLTLHFQFPLKFTHSLSKHRKNLNQQQMANYWLRKLLQRRRWTNKDYAIAAVGFALIVFISTFISDSFTAVDSPSSAGRPPFIPTADLVDLTLLHSAKDRGALCLDGSVPAYHFQKGFGSGSNNWLLHIEGGGWCDTVASCSARSRTALGSSRYMDKRVMFAGILSRDSSQNPEFFNWNKVKIRYCDGASLAGHPESELKNGTTRLFFRGQLIWEAIMDALLPMGLSSAKQALFTGCSAGGLATLIHCDNFRGRLPKNSNVKCLADASYFLDEKDVSGNYTMRSFYHDVVQLQGLAKSLPEECTSRSEPSLCLFPQRLIKSIKTPVFLVNPAYDFWQIQHVLVPYTSNVDVNWKRCRLNINACSRSNFEVLQGFRNSLLSSLNELRMRKDAGMFINSCYIHCQTWVAETWHSLKSPRINNKTIAESVGDWFFGRKEAKNVDCPYPCNPTCYNMDFTRA